MHSLAKSCPFALALVIGCVPGTRDLNTALAATDTRCTDAAAFMVTDGLRQCWSVAGERDLVSGAIADHEIVLVDGQSNLHRLDFGGAYITAPQRSQCAPLGRMWRRSRLSLDGSALLVETDRLMCLERLTGPLEPVWRRDPVTPESTATVMDGGGVLEARATVSEILVEYYRWGRSTAATSLRFSRAPQEHNFSPKEIMPNRAGDRFAVMRTAKSEHPGGGHVFDFVALDDASDTESASLTHIGRVEANAPALAWRTEHEVFVVLGYSLCVWDLDLSRAKECVRLSEPWPYMQFSFDPDADRLAAHMHGEIHVFNMPLSGSPSTIFKIPDWSLVSLHSARGVLLAAFWHFSVILD